MWNMLWEHGKGPVLPRGTGEGGFGNVTFTLGPKRHSICQGEKSVGLFKSEGSTCKNENKCMFEWSKIMGFIRKGGK